MWAVRASRIGGPSVRAGRVLLKGRPNTAPYAVAPVQGARVQVFLRRRYAGTRI